jgi:Leucine-rich repeat (LRR) protein
LTLKDTLQHLNLGALYCINGIYEDSSNGWGNNYIGQNEHSLTLLTQLPHLKSLFLNNNGIGDNGAQYISQLKSLTALDVGYNNIGNTGIGFLNQLSSLRSLAIHYKNSS